MLVIAAPCFASQDSVKVVKGQVSDYYIPVVNEYELTGIVTDEHDQPLEGATVMFLQVLHIAPPIQPADTH